MNRHTHIFLCDSDQLMLHDGVFYDMSASVSYYLDIMCNSFGLNEVDRIDFEAKMSALLDIKNDSLVYFYIGDNYYGWVTCSKCYLVSMN